jgi:hypothetical protein
MAFVPQDLRTEPFPCRHIPLTDVGETIDYFYRCGTQQELENALVAWLKKTIHVLEQSPVTETISESVAASVPMPPISKSRSLGTRVQIEEKTKCQV